MAATLTNLPSKIASLAKETMSHDQQHLDGIKPELDARVQEFLEQAKKGAPYTGDIQAVGAVIDAVKHLNAVDDRKMLLEYALVYLSRHKSPEARKLERATIKLLYNDLSHPPSTYVGEPYCYRSADGSGNNVWQPELGKAGMPYARSVQQTMPQTEMPDAGLIFDTLLRREAFVPHPAGSSSMMFSFAALVIHTIFRTSHDNFNINETSSYADLAPLYGHNQEAMDKMRMRDGCGLLVPDAFAENRLLLLPPAVCVLLVLFNRNHNYIAKRLLELNERGKYVDPASIPSDAPDRTARLLAQETDIFETARLINCGWFGSVIFSDYIAAILGLVREGNNWSLDPFSEMRNADHSLFERGRGNVCSVEFNCLYRWHATTSEADEEWVAVLTQQLFKGKPAEEVTFSEFKTVAKQMIEMEPDCHHWTFGALKRQENGMFKDEDLANLIKDATERPAGAFKARGTPGVMRLHEIMGIEQNRSWGVCSLNEFRKFLGLKPYNSFLEWNPDPEVASAAQKLYGDINRLELYPGLQAEEAKPVVEGAGLCPSYTISRAILSDAIALTRGDRFFTADLTPFNLTTWGFADCQRTPEGPGNGSTLGRLFLRTLPGQFTCDSTYSWFPLMTPSSMTKILTKLGQTEEYDVTRPAPVKPVVELTSYADAATVLKDETTFTTLYATRAQKVISGHGFFIASNDPKRAVHERGAIMNALIGAPGAEEQMKTFFFNKTKGLMLRESFTLIRSQTKSVDIIRDVLKCVPVYWACDMAGILLKSDPTDAMGCYTPQEMFVMLSEIYSYLFLDVEVTNQKQLRQKVTDHVKKLLTLIRLGLGTGTRLSIVGLVESLSSMLLGRKDGRDDILLRLSSLGSDVDTLSNSILAVMVGTTVELSQAMVHVLNFYLDDNKPQDVRTLAVKKQLETRDEAVLQGYVNEALRLDPTFRAIYRESIGEIRLSQGSYPANTMFLVNLALANSSGQCFKDPSEVNPMRGIDKYLAADGAARCLGQDLYSKLVVQAMRAVYSFPGLRRAPGKSGILTRYKVDVARTSTYAYLSGDSYLTPWATSMLVQF